MAERDLTALVGSEVLDGTGAPAQRDIAPPEPARDAPPLPPDSATSSFASGSPRTPEELQAQRELLRRAFVDAVMRARERQMQMQYGDTGYPQ